MKFQTEHTKQVVCDNKIIVNSEKVANYFNDFYSIIGIILFDKIIAKNKLPNTSKKVNRKVNATLILSTNADNKTKNVKW